MIRRLAARQYGIQANDQEADRPRQLRSFFYDSEGNLLALGQATRD
jgi:hypothetical protein